MARRLRATLRLFVARRLVNVMIYDGLAWKGSSHPHVRISASAVLQNPDGITLADDVFVGHFVLLDGTGGLVIGRGTQISSHAAVLTHSSHEAIVLESPRYFDVPESQKRGFVVAATHIGEDVFVGTGAVILPGVRIGDRCVVGANAVVTKDLEPDAIVVGVPARLSGYRTPPQ